jgi:glutathione-regulated potassium-efflux system ancillary protein KefG
MSNKVLVIFAHPSIEGSRINRALINAIPSDVTFHDLYENYPEQMIDVIAEQTLIELHDVVVFQHPLYWYSCPALMKNWIDSVLAYNWAYGPDGNALQGKSWVHAISSGGAAGVYQRMAYNQFSIAELLRPFEQTAALCAMDYLQPFLAQDANNMTDTELQANASRYRQWLQNLLEGDMPPKVRTVHAPLTDFSADDIVVR